MQKVFKLVNAVQELSLARDVDRVMEIVRTSARELTNADGATFVFLEGDQCYYADEDAIHGLWKGQRIPVDSCISGWVMKNRQPVVIQDIYQDDRIPHALYKPTFVKSLLMVPIRKPDPIGAIGNYWASTYQPPQADIDLLQSLADITAVTLENVSFYKDLEKLVRERTAQLEASNGELSETNAELEGLAYSLSHDLRSPLRNINITLERLLKDHHPSDSDPARPLIDKAFHKVSALQSLITDLLVLFEAGKIQPNISNVSMHEIIQEVFEELRELERDRNIKLIIGNLHDAPSDKRLITQVWQNLIGNAVKYTSRKKDAIIKVEASRRDGEVVYCVEDNGAGFETAYAEKLFVPFQRLHSKHDFDGTGIGLAIVKKIITKHNGRVWAKGSPDNGASFFFTLPAKAPSSEMTG